MNVLLSIKPEFAEKILDGEKRYEFRKTGFRSPRELDSIYLYASSPIQEIVGSFTVSEVIEADPVTLWEEFGEESGIENRARFMDYFSGATTGFAIEIDEVESLDSPIDPREQLPGFRPPVSFQYIGRDLDSLLNRCPKPCGSD